MMKKIKNIIVPTDFSVTSRNAYHYAKRLAVTLDATITVLHVNQYFMPIDEIAIGSISEDEVTKMSEEAMQAFVVDEDGIDHWTMIKHRVKTSVMKGDLVPILVGMSKQSETDLIVMGMTGLQDFIGKIIGSASLDVSNKAHCPVILVPRDAKWHKIEKVMYASNFTSITPKMVGNITDFALAVNAGVHFIHVEDATKDYKKNVAKIIWASLFSADDAPPLSYEIHTIEAGNTIEQLQKYAQDNQINLMTFMSKHRSFWQNLVHTSVTENMAISTEIPMMVMHLDD
jgi:nucleotide-binding universal stress UspA family protein